MITDITLQEAIEGVKGLFCIGSNPYADGESYMVRKACGGATFLFNKKQYERYEVVERIEKYFEDKNIVDGMCIIDPMTIVWTIVRLHKRQGK